MERVISRMTVKMAVKQVTCTAPVNIAVIKYWGKRDEQLILPTNSSLSVTLDPAVMSATTTAAASQEFTSDRLWLNGREENISNNPRLQQCLREVRRLYAKQRRKDRHDSLETKGGEEEDMSRYHLHICSENNFPTAAGLASSAAGYACLVATLAKLYGIEGDLSPTARLGSGSACRSMYGGIVKWEQGSRDDGMDSIAVQVAPETLWPELEVLILVVSDHKKPISSTEGMRRTVETSELLKYRAEVVVPRRMLAMEKAVLSRDFQEFAHLTMQDSNQFHAVCLDTYPPISYLTDTSHSIIQLITAYNAAKGSLKAAYTFDAGPNAVIYALSQDIPEILSLVCDYFPTTGDKRLYVKGLSAGHLPGPVAKELSSTIPLQPQYERLQYVIHTKVGKGPSVASTPLLDEKGFPFS